MKKILALILSALMILSLASCGSASKTTAAAKEGGLTNIKVGFITLHDENSTYDKNFLDAAAAACDSLGIPEANRYFKKNVPESSACEEAALDLIDSGCTYIFADSFGHEDFLINAAKAHPEVSFCHATGTKAHTAGVSNFHNAFASIYEGRYIAGVVAGLKLEEMIKAGTITAEQAVVGYVGAFTYEEVISGYTSFFLGVQSIVPEATMYVQFTGSWYDQTLEAEAATTLIKNYNCVLISQHADSMGAPSVCEDNNVPNVSYNGSTQTQCPNTYLISSRIDWAPYFEMSITATAKGEAFTQDYVGDLKTGSVKVTDINTKACAAGTQEKIDAVRKELEAGTLKVFDTSKFTVGGANLTTYMANVDTDEAYTPDTEAIADGYFHESEYRSAPYFGVQIDGITLINSAF